MATIIHKGSPEHKQHLAGLAKDAKSKDAALAGAAVENLAQHESPKTAPTAAAPAGPTKDK